MAHNNDTINTDIVEFVRLGKLVSTNYTVRIPNYATFRALMGVLGAVNSFDPQQVADTFEPLFNDSEGIEFGADGSEVLYVVVPFHDHQRNGATTHTGRRFTDDERRDHTQRIIDWAREVNADEITVQQFPPAERVWNEPGENPYRVRIWWD